MDPKSVHLPCHCFQDLENRKCPNGKEGKDRQCLIVVDELLIHDVIRDLTVAKFKQAQENDMNNKDETTQGIVVGPDLSDPSLAGKECEPADVSALNDELALEKEIQEKGLNAPRLTPKDVDAAIADVQYYVFPGTTTTVCCITLHNGFNVIGDSAAVSPENFDEAIGRQVAYDNARNGVWSVLGFRLKEYLFQQAQLSDGVGLTSKENAHADDYDCEGC